jgi:prepilin-type N-terminal cleavage/methylation domain-containing protein
MTLTSIQSTRPSRHGFSLVEVMLALAIFGVVATTILGVLSQGSSSAARTLEKNTAQAVLKQSFILVNKWVEEDNISLAATTGVNSLFPLLFSRDGELIGDRGVINSEDEDVLSQPFFEVSVDSSVLITGTRAVGLQLRVAWPYRASDNKRQEMFLSNVVIR